MHNENNRRRAWLAWLFVAALFLLCAALGVVQYSWISEVSQADRERLRGSLQASLDHISQDFNNELTAACGALLPVYTPGGAPVPQEPDAVEAGYAARYARWRRMTHHGQIFSRISLAVPQDSTVILRNLDLDKGVFAVAEWPESWTAIRQRLEARLIREPWQDRRPPTPPTPSAEEEGLVFELPRFGPPPGGGPPGRFGRRESGWLIIELNLPYVRDVMLGELLQRRLWAGGRLDYQVEVVTRRSPQQVIYRSDPNQKLDIASSADASAGLFAIQFEQFFRPGAFPGMRERRTGPGPGLRRSSMEDSGRWQMYARHRAGSLDAVVSRARWGNLAVTAAILLLMVITAAALIRFTRDAQRLAELQMNFVAGVSHELRTPLTVIHTAAYNLRGGVARNPSQVERYGALIQQESGRLGRLVEQVLRFANSNAGRAIRTPEPVSVESVIEDALESCKQEIEGGQFVVESKIEPGLPLVLGDAEALRHALQNLVGNAAKYGTEGGNWIGVFASAVSDGQQQAVEIRVADHGPGIPEDEQEHIFDPFFRGRQALRDQVHGTGLGLNLAKKIVEAHGGTIRVRSELMKGAEFIVRIPAAPAEQQDEFTNLARRG